MMMNLSKKLSFSKRLKEFHKDQMGAALVSVMIAVIFLSVLATIILYVAGNNSQMKATDYGTKIEFYESERVLEIMQSQLVKDVSVASMTAYTKVMSNFLSLNIIERKDAYHAAFKEAFLELYNSDGTAPDNIANRLLNGTATQNGYVYLINGADSTLQDSFYFDQVGEHSDAFSVIERDTFSLNPGPVDPLAPPSTADEWHLEIKNVSLVYTNAAGYTSIITTDLMVIPPAFNWNPANALSSDPTTKTNVDCMDCVTYINWRKE